MTPERIVALVARWVRLYTRGVPRPIALRRVEEIDADLYDHVAHERAAGTTDRDIAFSILSRMARGVTADVTWRRQAQPSRGDPLKPLLALLALALGVAVVAAVLDSPVLLIVAVLGIAGVVIGTFVLSVKTALQGDFLVPMVVILGGALGLSAVAVAAIVIGERGDAPGLILLGIAMITSVVVGAFAFGMRTAQRGSR